MERQQCRTCNSLAAAATIESVTTAEVTGGPEQPGAEAGTPQVRVRLLGPTEVTAGERSAGPWERPAARRLVELVLVSPGRRISRDLACEELFARLEPRAAARALSKALSMA